MRDVWSSKKNILITMTQTRKKDWMPEGQIRKAISGFYYVEKDGKLIQCKGRGVFRNRGIHPLVGDFVTYVPDGENDATDYSCP